VAGGPGGGGGAGGACGGGGFIFFCFWSGPNTVTRQKTTFPTSLSLLAWFVWRWGGGGVGGGV